MHNFSLVSKSFLLGKNPWETLDTLIFFKAMHAFFSEVLILSGGSISSRTAAATNLIVLNSTILLSIFTLDFTERNISWKTDRKKRRKKERKTFISFRYFFTVHTVRMANKKQQHRSAYYEPTYGVHSKKFIVKNQLIGKKISDNRWNKKDLFPLACVLYAGDPNP